MVNTAAPERGDIVWVNFNPTLGHEQQGRRPALVLSPRVYNAAAGLALVCPITSQIKGYPFEVSVTVRKKRSAVLVDHVRSVDWQEREVRKIGSVSKDTLASVQDRLRKLLF